MQYRQKPGETTDDFVTTARTSVPKFQLTYEELNEHLIEFIIVVR